MEDNIDVRKELEVKNHEIFINKMIIDLEKAMESLIMFYNNFCDTMSYEVINKTKSYLNNNDDTSLEMVTTLTNKFFMMLKGNLNIVIHERLGVIKSNIQNIDSFNYEKSLVNEALVISNKMSDFYQEKIYELIDALKDSIQEHQLDLKDYLLTTLYLKLMNVLKEKLMDYIGIISNNYDENTTMLQTINEKTLK